MARLYTNENFPLPAVLHLRQLGHNVLTSYEADQANQAIPDDKVLEFATSQSRALVTLNRKHFIPMHKIVSRHEGIIVCVFDSNFKALAENVHLAIEANEPIAGKLIRVKRENNPNSRPEK